MKNSKMPFKCPYGKFSCPYIDTSGMYTERSCKDCEVKSESVINKKSKNV